MRQLSSRHNSLCMLYYFLKYFAALLEVSGITDIGVDSYLGLGSRSSRFLHQY